MYGLTSQIRRSASSIGANIAEGCGRGSDADMGRFLQIAMGSACELEYHLLLSRDLEILYVPDYELASSEVTEIKRMLSSLLAKVRASRAEN
jgi:four helix bundle protein